MTPVTERFLRYVRIDTESDPASSTCPSTPGQLELAALLASELRAMGAADAAVDENGYVTATIPANTARPVPVLGFIAHMDTSPDMRGGPCHPRIVHDYDGGPIALDEAGQFVLDPAEFGSLRGYIGQDLIVTDGTTLLGADDKSGVAAIMAMAETLFERPEIEHGKIRIAFTPDEEIGRGPDRFDVAAFGANYAYTVDGGELGEIEYENFNAADAHLVFHGVSIHPGSAKGRMVNALRLAMQFDSLLPRYEDPACTEGYEGFSHLVSMSGVCERAEARYILRDHDREKFGQKKARFEAIANFFNATHGEGTVELSLTDTYYTMKEQIEPHLYLIDGARRAMQAVGVEPKVIPIRGGTDGVRLSFMGLPCPNLCAGGVNMHGKFEYLSVQTLEKIVELLVELVRQSPDTLPPRS